MISPEFPKATEVVANTSIENDSIELIPIEDEDSIEIVATKVVIDSISTDSGKIGDWGE